MLSVWSKNSFHGMVSHMSCLHDGQDGSTAQWIGAKSLQKQTPRNGAFKAESREEAPHHATFKEKSADETEKGSV